LPPIQFNYPFQLGPLSPTSPREHAQRLNVPVQENDIVILSTDGMTDNLWDEDVIQQVIRFTSAMPTSPSLSAYPKQPLSPVRSALLPITLSHALCTKARSVAENGSPIAEGELPEIPFGRRAKEAGHSFVGGKQDGKLIPGSHPIWSSLVTRRP
jgi:protein phosphatase PTC7